MWKLNLCHFVSGHVEEKKINQVLPYSHCGNAENRNWEDPVLATAQERLNRVQDSLKSKVPLKELSQISREDTTSTKSLTKVLNCAGGQKTAGLLSSMLFYCY